MTLEEKKSICDGALFGWIMTENGNKDMTVHDKDVENLFTSQIILKKFKVFDIDIVLPDMLLLILNICTEGNPGQFQIILKTLLNDIKKSKGPIPKGYVIRSRDFGLCFNNDYPITEIPSINEKYEALWDQQKKQGKLHLMESENLCDTVEWWKEVME